MREHDIFLERALQDAGRLTREQLDTARGMAAEQGVALALALVSSELMTGREVALVRADICEVPYVNLADYEPCFANTALLPRHQAESMCVYPLFHVDGVLTVVMEDPLNLEAADQVRQLTRCEVDTVIAEREHIEALIARAYSLSQAAAADSIDGGSGNRDEAGDDLDDEDSSQPVVAAVNQIMADAVDRGASDVHLNPDEHELHIRYRVDGVLAPTQGPPLSMHSGLVQRLKVMANLDLTQTRRPQDGKFRYRRGNRLVDVRMSTLPTVCGENVVLRLLASNQSVGDFHELGLSAPMASRFEEMTQQPYGIILVTGPTGSGKTTTLYSALSKLNEPSRNIMTIEDPVEIRLPFVRQVQVHSEIGMSFANALRSILRQDPDVILVGEIRDEETATIALQSALTGHLVLSTLHTNDAAGAVARLRDYGLPSFVINAAVLGIMAQRLVRRVCQHCVGPMQPDDLMRHRFRLGREERGFVQGKGCARCGQSGYRGRLGLYELLSFTPTVKRLVEQEGSADQIREAAVADGMKLMGEDGLEKARLGLTTLEEVAKTSMVAQISDEEELSLRKSA